MEKEILYALHRHKVGYISGEELASRFKVTRTSIWNWIDHFRDQGYVIEAHPHLGYRLIEVPDRMLPDEIKYGLKTKIIGRNIHTIEKTGSTNDIAWDLAGKGAPPGTVVFAECQTRGRGRMQRNWFSASRKGLFFSVILRPSIKPGYAPMVVSASAVACARAIAGHTGLSVWIKWPNDIYINNKKAGGILTELNTELDRLKFAILGIGINVNAVEFPAEIKKTATSLKKEGGKIYSRIELAREILRWLDFYYQLLLNREWDRIRAEWRDLSLMLGKRVSVDRGDIIQEGQALGISDKGALMVRLDNGIIEQIFSGDVRCC